MGLDRTSRYSEGPFFEIIGYFGFVLPKQTRLIIYVPNPTEAWLSPSLCCWRDQFEMRFSHGNSPSVMMHCPKTGMRTVLELIQSNFESSFDLFLNLNCSRRPSLHE
jgi:hypothetical protein